MRITILFTLLFFTVATTAQPADTTITVVAHWCKGDTMCYQYEQADFKIQGTDTTCTDYAYEEMQIVVCDSTDRGFSLEYKPLSTKTEWGKDSVQRALRSYMVLQLKDHPVLLSTNKAGTVTHIDNWRQLRDILRQGLQEMLDNSYNPSNHLQQFLPRNRLEALLNMEFATEENLRNSLDELNLLFGLHGLSVSIGQQQLNDTTSHPTTTTITASFGTYGNKGFNNDYNICIQSETIVSAEEARYMADNMMDLVLADDLIGKVNHILGDGKSSPLRINNTENYHYFFNGWPCMMLQQQIINYQGMQHVKMKRLEWTRRVWTEKKHKQVPQTTF